MDLGQVSWVRPEEQSFIRNMMDVCVSVQQQQNWRLTDFLTPREQFLLTSVVNKAGLVYATDGGIDVAERKRALIMPADWQPERSDFQVTILRATPNKGVRLHHGEALGSLLGTGLLRRKVGDIFLDDDVYVVVNQDIVPFILTQWHHVGRESVSVDIAQAPPVWQAPKYEEMNLSVASMRLDALLAHATHWSRKDAQEAIEKGKVTLNFMNVSKPDSSVATGDILSIRGFGRVKVIAELGESKRGRLRFTVGVLKSNN